MVVVPRNLLCSSFYHNQEFFCPGGCCSHTQINIVHLCQLVVLHGSSLGNDASDSASPPELTCSSSFTCGKPQREVSVLRKQLQDWSLSADITPRRLWFPLETYCWELFLWCRLHCLYNICFMPEMSHHQQKSNVIFLAESFLIIIIFYPNRQRLFLALHALAPRFSIWLPHGKPATLGTRVSWKGTYFKPMTCE